MRLWPCDFDVEEALQAVIKPETHCFLRTSPGPTSDPVARRTILVLALSALLLGGCAVPGGGPLESLEIGPKHGIVIGRVRVVRAEQILTDGARVTFAPLPSTSAYWNSPGFYSYRLDATGYVFTQLPLGEYELAEVSHPQEAGFLATFVGEVPKGPTRFQVREPGAVHYIGDITLDWRKGDRTRTTVLAWLIPYATSTIFEGPLGVQVEERMAETKARFDVRFPNHLPVTDARNPTSRSDQGGAVSAAAGGSSGKLH
jgi:hypothetical protein